MSEADLKVLLLAGRFEARGSCAYTVRLAEHLREQGVSAEVACSSAAMVPQAKRAELPFVEFPRLGLPVLSRFAVHELRQHWKEDAPNLIHVQSRNVLPLGNQLSQLMQLPYVLTVHDFLHSRERLKLNRRWAKRIIAVSDAVKADLVQQTGIADGAITVIRSGVEAQSAPPRLDAEGEHIPVIGAAGPLEPIKGYPFFLRAAQLVLAEGLVAEFLIAGTGPEEHNLRRLARELGIAEHVTFVPYVREYTEVLDAMDIFCLPSLQQGLGTVMLEAMALGKPVIATGVGGVYSAVHDGETGVLIPQRNSAALAEKMIELLRDPNVARRLGANARRLVTREFGLGRMVEATARLYREVMRDSALLATGHV